MEKFFEDALRRLGLNPLRFNLCVRPAEREYFRLSAVDGKVAVEASTRVAAMNGVYRYLKKYCGVNLSFCGNRTLQVATYPLPDEVLYCEIPQKLRVYLNYCTLGYTMPWYSLSDWEREIDFMALNGVNAPLTVVGTEAVWFETLLQFGYSREEALKTVSGAAYWPWQLMTNIIGYMPPTDEKYIYERLRLGQKINERVLEYGMTPIQQGFGGNVPPDFKLKHPRAKCKINPSWCHFPPTATLSPTDGLFQQMGEAYLACLKKYFGAHGLYACDPFHESAPPSIMPGYLARVGRAIDGLFQRFDAGSKWVMQSWSIRKKIACAVPRGQLLVLDIDGKKQAVTDSFWGHEFVTGDIHNFGGRSSVFGDMTAFSKNTYGALKKRGLNVVGSGLFPEGLGQNPMVYELLFERLCTDRDFKPDSWLSDYAVRRTGDPATAPLYRSLLQSCYGKPNFDDTQGSAAAAWPSLSPQYCGGWDKVGVAYDFDELNATVKAFSAAAKTAKKDGFYYDYASLVVQALSNKFLTNVERVASAFKKGDVAELKRVFADQVGILRDMDSVAAMRPETDFRVWVQAAADLATDEAERQWFVKMARSILTVWGDVDGDCFLYDYAWREWSGLLSDLYLPRWQRFFDYLLDCLECSRDADAGISYYAQAPTRLRLLATKQDAATLAAEKAFACAPYEEKPITCHFDTEVIDKIVARWLD